MKQVKIEKHISRAKRLELNYRKEIKMRQVLNNWYMRKQFGYEIVKVHFFDFLKF